MILRDGHILLADDIQTRQIVLDTSVCFELEVEEAFEYRFTGEVCFEEHEKEKAALISVAFDRFEVNADNIDVTGLNYSANVGAYKYLQKNEENTFDITVKIPQGVKKINVTVTGWFNQGKIKLGKMIFFQKINPKNKKVFERCRQLVFTSLASLKIVYDEPVLYRYIHDEFPFEWLAHFKSSSEKLVVLGTAAIKPEISLPVFQRHTYMNQITDSCMIMHDPTLYNSRKLLVGWYQGGKNLNVFDTIYNIMKHILQITNIFNKNVLFYGSSAGAFFSLMMSGYLKNSIALITNPQTNVLKYNARFVDTLVEIVYDDKSQDKLLKEHGEELSVILFYKTLDFFPKIWYRQNRVDLAHYKNQLMPFLEFYVSYTEEHEHVNSFMIEMYSHEKGHNAVADIEELKVEISRAYRFFNEDKGEML